MDISADARVRRENIYSFVQNRLDGLSFERMEYRTYGNANFGIELAALSCTWQNLALSLAEPWLGRD